MKNLCFSFLSKVFVFQLVILLGSCKKIKEFDQKPEIDPIQQGLKASAAIGYCASIFVSAFKGDVLPSNVIFNKNLGIIYITIDKEHPLPFNRNTGTIIIAGLWRNNGGIISILFGDLDVLGGKLKLYGLYTVPVIKRDTEEDITTVFAKQDIIVGYGSDTILNIGNITDLEFNYELDRLNQDKPTDAFVAVKQNVWFMNINQSGTSNNVYDDVVIVNGGGQIVETNSTTGGILYHAMINSKMNFSVCTKSPLEGYALIQNFKAGNEFFIDLGNAFLSFHSQCDGMAHVDFSSGKYVGYYGKNIPLDLQ